MGLDICLNFFMVRLVAELNTPKPRSTTTGTYVLLHDVSVHGLRTRLDIRITSTHLPMSEKGINQPGRRQQLTAAAPTAGFFVTA